MADCSRFFDAGSGSSQSRCSSVVERVIGNDEVGSSRHHFKKWYINIFLTFIIDI